MMQQSYTGLVRTLTLQKADTACSGADWAVWSGVQVGRHVKFWSTPNDYDRVGMETEAGDLIPSYATADVARLPT